MSFLETPRFPACPNFDFTANPRYSVTISQTASGKERRNRNWARPLSQYTVIVGPQHEDEIQELLEFWHAVGGQEAGFRFKDQADYKSRRVGQTATSLDQTLALTPGSPGGYQLVKQYVFGSRSQVRTIYKPVQGTIVVADDGVLRTEGSEYVIDYSTGLMTLFFVPNGVISWGGEFDVPVRFDSEFPIDLINYRIGSVTFTLTELRDPTIED